MRTCATLITLMTALALAGCAPTFRNHGYIPPEEELQEIVVGRDTRATVEEAVGPPSSSSLVGDGDFYYVRSRTRTFGMRETKEIDRQVLAITFDSRGVVENIERFGLENGQVVPLTRRVTASGVSDVNLLRQLMGNIGNIGAAGFGS
ncbi:outer membrane protein assembly factor BamE [Tateyamaria pelophila]|uniref:outer membrane protein assembly factor BamE n=1 Tax=Tateyamaria pelophila TaxID=328415 RepID=UPI001CC137C5|nr:outer membrane protein assembly factor BamE [Tateyamaria pelophila]